MLTWPIILMIGVFFLQESNLNKKSLLKDVISKWIASYFTFLIYFYGYGALSGTGREDFDPSGHVTASIVSLCQYLCLAQWASKTEREQIQKVCWGLYFFNLVHSFWSIYYTVYGFHTKGESNLGWMFGVLITIPIF